MFGSLHGGGVRGVIQAHLLARLVDACPGLLDQIDMWAGTSIGGINALALARGMRPDELVRLFIERAAEIFDARTLHQVRPGAKYGAGGLRAVLEDVFGDLRLADLPKRVLISSYDCHRRDAKFWHSWPGPTSDGAAKCVDVALTTSAAPTFFPARASYIDGGVAANDPAVCVVAKARKEGIPLDAMRVLSIGTGRPSNAGFDPGDWGAVRWLPHIIGVTLDGPMGVARYQAAALLGDNFHELQVDLPEDIPLDAADRVLELVEAAERADIRSAIRWVREHVTPAARAA